MKSTVNGNLVFIPDCYIQVMSRVIRFKVLPDVSDSHGAAYQDEVAIGRSVPIKTFSHGENRSLNTRLHFVVMEDQDAENNLRDLAALRSATYPRTAQANNPYLPPPICKLKVGKLLSRNPVCAVLRSCSVSFPTDVAWYNDEQGNGNYCPYKFDVDCTWDVVYTIENLPGQESVMTDY